jgi:hypothetical protein
VRDISASPARKRSLEEDSNKENQLPGSLSPPKKRKYKKRRTTDQKLCEIFKVIHEADWGLSDFLYFVFRREDTEGQDIHREQAHGNMVQKFLAGNCTHTPAQILHSWYHSKDGRIEDPTLMFSTTTPYTKIRGVRECLTSFAVQVVERRLVREATNAVESSSGLHAAVSHKTMRGNVEWVDMGATTVPDVAQILKKFQPLTWHYFTQIAARKPRVRNGVVLVRQRRPVEAVSSLLLPYYCLMVSKQSC